jgi:hypothetical protein
MDGKSGRERAERPVFLKQPTPRTHQAEIQARASAALDALADALGV